MTAYAVRRRSDSKVGYKEKTYGANQYPKGAVPEETGWYGHEHSLSKPEGHNKITVCRGRKGYVRRGQ